MVNSALIDVSVNSAEYTVYIKVTDDGWCWDVRAGRLALSGKKIVLCGVARSFAHAQKEAFTACRRFTEQKNSAKLTRHAL